MLGTDPHPTHHQLLLLLFRFLILLSLAQQVIRNQLHSILQINIILHGRLVELLEDWADVIDLAKCL